MEPESSTTPVTDVEQWSDESGHEAAGYAQLGQDEALGYEALVGEEEDGGEEQGAADEAADAWREAAEDGGRSESTEESQQQVDVATLMLRAMEADYRACVESKRTVGNEHTGDAGPLAQATSTSAQGPPAEEADQAPAAFAEKRAPDEAPVAEAASRPTSPLGQDRAERVMRAMQGFVLPGPALPPPRFEVDWESAREALAPGDNALQGEELARQRPTSANK